MSIFSKVTEQDLISLSKLAKQQKEQRVLKIKNRSLKQTHDVKLAESISPITKNLDIINETTKNLGKTVQNSDVEDGNAQTPAIENITVTQSLRDTLALMKRSKNSFKVETKENGGMFWNGVFNKPLGDNNVSNKNEEYDINPDIQAYFTTTKLTTKRMDVEKNCIHCTQKCWIL